MNQNLVDFRKKFHIPEYNIYETDYWIWSLRPTHCTLGAGILSTKEHHERFSDITIQESQDLQRIVKTIENTLKRVFNQDKMNYLMLMMVDFHVHFHVIPRYGRDINFAGINWADGGWPALPKLDAPPIDEKILFEIIREIKKNLQIF